MTLSLESILVNQMYYQNNKFNLSSSLRAGQIFEATIAFNLMRDCPNSYVFSDLSVPLGNSFTTIDLLVLIGDICIVAEMKNYSKSLEGDLSLSYWYARNNEREFKIRNPMKQNNYHCVSLVSALLKERINISSIIFNDYIIVPNSCRLIVPPHLLTHILTQLEWEIMLSEYNSKIMQNQNKINLELRKMMNKWRNMSN